MKFFVRITFRELARSNSFVMKNSQHVCWIRLIIINAYLKLGSYGIYTQIISMTTVISQTMYLFSVKYSRTVFALSSIYCFYFKISLHFIKQAVFLGFSFAPSEKVRSWKVSWNSVWSFEASSAVSTISS